MTLKQYLLQQLDICTGYVQRLALEKGDSFEDIHSLPEQELPLHVNDEEPAQTLVRARLEGKVLTEEPALMIQCLTDTAFDIETYKTIGYNDGQLSVIAEALSQLGEQEAADKAIAYIYSYE